MGGIELTPELMIFGGLAGAAALAAVGVVAFGNAVRSAMCLVVNFLILAVLYFSLGAEMLGILQIVVYTGAIMVLFLFVIMLLNLGGGSMLKEKRDPRLLMGGVLGFGLFAIVATQVLVPLQSVNLTRAPDGFGAPAIVGRALFTSYVWPFELASFLLLVGIVGSILLAKRRI